MKIFKIFFAFFLFIFISCLNINCQIKDYKNKILKYDWPNIETSLEQYKLGVTIVNELNDIFMSKNIFEKVEKISDGYIKADYDKEILIDYNELFVDKIDYLVFYDKRNDLLMVSKNDYLYFVKENIPFKIKLNSVFFNSTDFEVGKYSIDRLNSKIENCLYNCPIINKNEVFNYYDRLNNWWKKYFINPNDEIIIFKPDIEYDLKFEILIPNGQMLPSKLLPLWQKYVCPLKKTNSPELLNNLILIPNFYEVWKERHEKWLNNSFELKDETKILIDKTKNNRLMLLTDFDKKNVKNLSKKVFINLDATNDIISMEEKYDIVKLNRNLLEETFTEDCPKSLELKFIPETIFGDFDNSISVDCSSVLIEKNLKSKIIVENNKEVKDIGVFSSISKDKYQNQYYLNEYMKKIFSKTNLITISMECNSNLVYDKKKYIVFNSNYNSNTLKTGFIDYYDGIGEIKSSIKLKYYFETLSDYFDNNKKGKAFDEIYRKAFDLAFKLSAFSDAKLFHNNKYYNFSNYKEIAMILIKLQYNYLKKNLEKINFESENWEIPVSFIQYDENVFSDYFLDYQAN